MPINELVDYLKGIGLNIEDPKEGGITMKQVSFQQDKDKLETIVGVTKIVVTDRNLTLSISVDDLKIDKEPFVSRNELDSVLKRIEDLEIKLSK